MIKNILTVLFSLLITFILIELFCRSFFSGEEVKSDFDFTYGAGYGYVCDHGWCPNEGVYNPIKRLKSGEEIYNVHYTINEDRTRNVPKNMFVEPAFIVNFFGGSFIYGEGLNDNQTLPFYFRSFAPTVTVRNYGFHGYGLHNALRLIETNVAKKSNVNVFLTGAYHAYRAACVPSYSTHHPSYELSKSRLRNTKFISACHKRQSDEIRYLKWSYFHEIYDIVLRRSYAMQYALRFLRDGYLVSQISLYQNIIKDLAVLSSKRGEQVFFLHMREPWVKFLSAGYTSDPMLDFYKDNSIDVLDASLASDITKIDSKYYLHELDKHPSALANCHRAKLLVQSFINNGLINVKDIDKNYSCMGIGMPN